MQGSDSEAEDGTNEKIAESSLSLSVSLPLALCLSLSKDGTDEQIAESSHFEQKDGAINLGWLENWTNKIYGNSSTAWKVFKYEVFSSPYFLAFSPNTGK